MKRIELLVDQQKMFALTQDPDGSLFLEVATGGFAMENLVIRLTEEESRKYREEGRAYLNELAYEVQKNTSRFRGRMTTT